MARKGRTYTPYMKGSTRGRDGRMKPRVGLRLTKNAKRRKSMGGSGG